MYFLNIYHLIYLRLFLRTADVFLAKIKSANIIMEGKTNAKGKDRKNKSINQLSM